MHLIIENGATSRRVKESGRTENKHFAEAKNIKNIRNYMRIYVK